MRGYQFGTFILFSQIYLIFKAYACLILVSASCAIWKLIYTPTIHMPYNFILYRESRQLRFLAGACNWSQARYNILTSCLVSIQLLCSVIAQKIIILARVATAKLLFYGVFLAEILRCLLISSLVNNWVAIGCRLVDMQQYL